MYLAKIIRIRAMYRFAKFILTPVKAHKFTKRCNCHWS